MVEKGLKEYAWDYIKSDSAAALERNRHRLAEMINEPEYVNNVWKEKEEKVIHWYTKGNANLGCTSSQRVESFHPVLRQMTNGQLTLEISVTRLC